MWKNIKREVSRPITWILFLIGFTISNTFTTYDKLSDIESQLKTIEYNQERILRYLHNN